MSVPRLSVTLAGLGLVASLAGCGTMISSGSPGAVAASPAPTAPAGAATPTAGRYTLIQEPQAGYEPIYDFISSANKSLDMTMYALVDPKATAALIGDAGRGVAVRVLFDSDPVGGGGPAVNQAAYDELKAGGVQVEWSFPGSLWHQKSIVRDGDAVAIMNCNLYASYYPVLRDFIVITGNPATISGVEATFEADFGSPGSPPAAASVPAGSDLIWSPGAGPGLVSLLASARAGTTLYAENEQLDSPVIEQALIAAATRGVTVDLTMSYSAAFVGGFDTLRAGGVHVALYAANAPLYIQAKAISVNGDNVYLGSTNFTTASLDDDRNVGIVTNDPAVAGGVTSTLASDFSGATPY